VRLADDLPPL